MKTKKRTKKAVTLLTKIEKLLSESLRQCSAIEKNVETSVRELLLSAQKSIVSAAEFVKASATFETPKKSAKKAKPAARAKKHAAPVLARKRALAV